MKDVEKTETKIVGVSAADGTIFYFNDDKEKAREECKKYEKTAASVVYDRIKNVLICSNENKTIKQQTLKGGQKVIEDVNFSFRLDEDISRFYNYYNYKTFIFQPKTKEDIENFKMYAELIKCGYIYNYEKIVPNETYVVCFDEEGSCTLVKTKQMMIDDFKESVEKEFSALKAYLNPEKYIRSAYREYKEVE